MSIERSEGIGAGLRDFFKDSNLTNVSTGIMGGFTIGLIAIPLVMRAGEAANLPPEVVASWLFSVYFFGGIVGIILALKYKQPICGAWSIPGIFAVTQVLGNFSMNEAVGAFLISGAIVLVIGLTGWIKKIVNFIPISIMNAMVAGVLFKWALQVVDAFENAPLLCLIGVIGYGVSRTFLRRVPPVLGTFVFAIAAAAFTGQLNFSGIEFGLAKPMLFIPTFSVGSIISISIPLALLVIGAENMQAVGVLKTEHYKAPINAMTVASGIGGLIAPWFGGHNANIAGPMTAFCTSPDAGEREGRYVAAVWNGILFALLGLFAPLSLGLIHALPKELIMLLVGLSLLGIIIEALSQAFGQRKLCLGCFAAFVVSMSGVTILTIGSAFWALVIGSFVSMIFEKKGFVEEFAIANGTSDN
jgi:benzoate membrane transport protein